MKRQVVWALITVLIIGSTTGGYFLAKDNKMEYALSGTLIGLVISLIIWTIVSKKVN